MQNHQLLLDNMSAIEHGVKRAASVAKLSKVDVADLVQDVCVKLLDGRLDSFDPEKGSATVFFRTCAWRVATDAVRALNRGGQFSGYLSGFGNAALDAERSEGQAPMTHAPARSTHAAKAGAVGAADDTGRAVRVSGRRIFDNTTVDVVAERQWSAQAREAVAGVLPGLTSQERDLYALLASGDFDAATYAAEHGISASTAHVRANRLRSKLRDLLRSAA